MKLFNIYFVMIKLAAGMVEELAMLAGDTKQAHDEMVNEITTDFDNLISMIANELNNLNGLLESQFMNLDPLTMAFLFDDTDGCLTDLVNMAKQEYRCMVRRSDRVRDIVRLMDDDLSELQSDLHYVVDIISDQIERGEIVPEIIEILDTNLRQISDSVKDIERRQCKRKNWERL